LSFFRLDLRLFADDEGPDGACGADFSSEGPAEGPALDIADVALPFLKRVEAARAGDSGGSGTSILVRFERPRDCGASTSSAGCSGLGSRVGALRFLETVDSGREGGAGGWAGVEFEEPAESLAEERVTLGDMRI